MWLSIAINILCFEKIYLFHARKVNSSVTHMHEQNRTRARLFGAECVVKVFLVDSTTSNTVLLLMIRKAVIDDVKKIQQLVNQYADRGLMLPRSLNELYENLRDFWIYDDGTGAILGVCALHVSWDGLAEVRSLAVDQEQTKKGIGSKLVGKCLAEAKELGAAQVFVLTYQDQFFSKLGFSPVDKKDLPHKIWTDCLNCVKFPNCDETSLIIKIIP